MCRPTPHLDGAESCAEPDAETTAPVPARLRQSALERPSCALPNSALTCYVSMHAACDTAESSSLVKSVSTAMSSACTTLSTGYAHDAELIRSGTTTERSGPN